MNILRSTTYLFINDQLNPGCNYRKRDDTLPDMEDIYSRENWLFLMDLSHRANGFLHQPLTTDDGKTVVILEKDAFFL